MANAGGDTRLKDKVALATGAASSVGQATAVLFLASDEMAFVTGAALPVDGGWDARPAPRQPGE